MLIVRIVVFVFIVFSIPSLSIGAGFVASKDGKGKTSTFPFGHETSKFKGAFSNYMELSSWYDPPGANNTPAPVEDLFCGEDFPGEPKGWVVVYVYMWNPVYGRLDFTQEEGYWTNLQEALRRIRNDLNLIPVVRIQFMAHHGGSMPDWEKVMGGIPLPLTLGESAWSVPPDPETYQQFGHRIYAYYIRSAFIGWCTELARRLRDPNDPGGPNDLCRWFILGNEINHPYEYGAANPNHPNARIVPPEWYADIWVECFTRMGRNADYSPIGPPPPTKSQLLVAPLTPEAPAAGQPWQARLYEYVTQVDRAYYDYFGPLEPPLKPGYAIHAYGEDDGGWEFPQLGEYISWVNYFSPLAQSNQTEYLVDEYHTFMGLSGTDPYVPSRITTVLDTVAAVRDFWYNHYGDNLRAACYYAYLVPWRGAHHYDLVRWDETHEIWKPNLARNLEEAWWELLGYNCSVWQVVDYAYGPTPSVLLGSPGNVTDRDFSTFFAMRMDEPHYPYPDLFFWVDMEPSVTELLSVAKVKATYHLGMPLSNTQTTLTLMLDGDIVYRESQHVTLHDGDTVTWSISPQVGADSAYVIVYGPHEIGYDLGFYEIEIESAPE